MNVVFDTGVLVAAFTTRGTCATLFEITLNRHRLFLSPHLLKADGIRAGDAAMGNVADDGYVKPFQTASLFPNRHHIQKGLRGMGVPSVAGVDDGTSHQPCQHVGSPGGPMPQNNHIGIHGLQIPGRVGQCLAFNDAAC